PPHLSAPERSFADSAVPPTRYQYALTHELIIRWSRSSPRVRSDRVNFQGRSAEEVERLDAEKLLEFGFIGKHLTQRVLGHLARRIKINRELRISCDQREEEHDHTLMARNGI